jgi:CHAT domain-containing protein/tetratricopeptide (TPR) repeat protein
MFKGSPSILTRGRRHGGSFILILLSALLLPSYAEPVRSAVRVTPYVQENAGPACSLTVDDSDCAVKGGEEVYSLRPGEVIEKGIAGGERHIYKIHLSPRQFLQTVVEQRGIDLSASVCVAGGRRVAEVDRQSGSWGPETISVIAEAEGEYLLQVRPVEDSWINGRYQIRIKDLRTSAPADKVQIDAERTVTEGGKYFSKGKPECLAESIKRYEQAEKLWRSLGNNYEVAVTLYGLGWSYTNLGAYGMVKFPFSRSQLRWSYESREEHLTASKYFNQSLAMMRALNNQHGQAMALAGLAYPDLYLGRTGDALNNFTQARQLFNSLNNKKGEAIATYGLGWSYALLGDDQKALESFSQALLLRRAAKDRRGDANTLAAISRIYSRLGNNNDALDYGQRALSLYEQLGDKHGRASTHAVLGWVYSALGRRQEAVRSFEEAITLRGDKDPTGKANALYGIARIQSEQGDLNGAVTIMKEVIDTVEGLRTKGGSSEVRTYYFANIQDYYEFYIRLLMQANELHPLGGYADLALGVNERARARELLTVLAKSEEGAVHEFDSKLGEPLDTAGIKGLLDDGTLLLEYSLGSESSYLWMVSPGEVRGYKLPKRSEIEEKALLLYRLMTERNGGRSSAQEPGYKQAISRADIQARAVAEELSKVLLGPVAQQIGEKRLVVVTQGVLQLVPFGSLPAPTASTAAAQMPMPLIVSHEIVSLPSASVLGMLRHKTGHPSLAHKTIAVLADPVFTKDDPRVSSGLSREFSGQERRRVTVVPATTEADGSRSKSEGAAPGRYFRRLPGTRWEARQIVDLVPKEDAFIALDFAASRETAMSEALRQYRIIHFATHAAVDDSDPALSKIIFSQFNAEGRAQNGDLTLADIYDMKLQADLIVLSACRTALGADTKGEGLIGLTGGFMHSGVPRVVVSMWPISDSVAAEMMARFYRKVLGEKKMAPAAALREVQIEMLKDERWEAAYFWAPFIFSGDWRWQ